MTKRYESLTPEEKARLPEIRRWWIKRAIRDTWQPQMAREAALECYDAAGLDRPKLVFCWESPLAAAVGMRLMQNSVRASVGGSVWASVAASVAASVENSVAASVGGSVWASVWNSVRASVGASVENSVGDSVREGVWTSVWTSVRNSLNSVRDSVGASVWASVGASVRNSVGASVWASVGASVESSVRDSVEASQWVPYHDGAGWCSWRAFYAAMDEFFGIASKLRPHFRLDQSGAFGWWWFRDSCHLLAPPKMHFGAGLPDGSEPYELHREDGPAVDWPHTQLWFLRGVAVDEQTVMRPETLTVEQIKQEANQEKRRIMRERFGDGKYLDAVGAQIIDVDLEGHVVEGGAERALVREDSGDQTLICTDGSTGRVYYLDVPAEVKTCREAHNALANFDEQRIVAKS